MVSFDSPATLEPLRSVHTTNLPILLKQLGVSLIVSTYQAGKVVLVRADGDALNTHFRVFQKPMGLAIDGTGRMAIGAGSHIWEFRNVPAAAPKLEPAGKHDACFLPRNIHVTGDIDIHEMDWGMKDFGLSIRDFHAFVRMIWTIVSFLAGDRPLSRPMLPKTAVISMDWNWWAVSLSM